MKCKLDMNDICQHEVLYGCNSCDNYESVPNYIECPKCGTHMKPKGYYENHVWFFWYCSWCGARW